MPHAPPGKRPRRTDREQLKHDVLLGLAAGLPLTVVARNNGTSQQSVDYWAKRDPAFAEEVAAARALGWDSLAAECLAIADDGRNDYVEQFNDEGESQGWRFNSENVLRSRLRIETRLKLLSKWDSGRYSDDKTVKLEGKVQTTTRHVLDPRLLTAEQRDALRLLLSAAAAQGLLRGPEPQDADYEELRPEEDFAGG